MADLARIVRRLGELPPRVVAQKVARRVGDRMRASRERSRDLRATTFDRVPPAGAIGSRLVGVPALPGSDRLSEACERYLDHRFDLLSSGWTSVAYGATVPGAFGVRHESALAADGPHDARLIGLLPQPVREESSRIRALISPEFEPIDWQRDIKSGWRWSESTWYGDVTTEGIPGADIKLPWELSRCHHLVQLAVLAHVSQDEAHVERLAREFRDTVLDFVAANPPRFGANWVTAMDVAIRATNLLVAHDLFAQTGAAPSAEFEGVFARSIQEHARFVFGHLEGTPWLRGNHYFADVTGLLFAASYLPRGLETDEWLGFASREFIGAVAEQFGDDGAGFEASTAYHGLTGQMAVWGSALILALADDPTTASVVPVAPTWLAERLERIGCFSADVTAPDGSIVQIGDNDSGRFIKPSPMFAGEGARLAEVLLDHGHVSAGVSALTSGATATPSGSPARHETEALLVRAVAGNRVLDAAPWSGATGIAPSAARLSVPSTALSWEFAASAGSEPLDAGLATSAYPDFGLYIWRSSRLYLAVRCGSVGQHGNGGHAHNDQLSIEAWLDGRPLVRDPGTGVYTPSKPTRDAYRSVGAHHAPRIEGREPGRLDTTFQITDSSPGVCIRFDATGFVGYHDGFGTRVWRSIRIDADAVRGQDWAEDGSPLVINDAPQRFSSGYGDVG